MSALKAMRCDCDPHEVAGLLPGRACPRCGFTREPMNHDELLVRLDDQRLNLGAAAEALRKALVFEYDGDAVQFERAVAVATELAERAANVLRFASAQFNEEGRPAIGVAGARDQSPGRP